ncbi:MAG: PH domain-containing protein [Candidatus Saccharimonadales bacterium]
MPTSIPPLDTSPKKLYANAMPKYFADQMDDEEVLFVFRKHPIVMRKGLIIGLLAVLIGPLYTLALTYLRPDNYPSVTFLAASFALSLVFGAILFFPSWIGWFYSVFIVTDQRLIQITQKGLFHRSVVDIGLPQIQMVNYEIAGLQETLLGFGTIMMQTYLGDLIIHEVHHPAKIQKKLLGILRDQGVLASGFKGKLTPNQVEDQEQEEE